MAKEYRRLAKLIAKYHINEGMDAAKMHDNILRWKVAKEDPNTYGGRALHLFFGDCLNAYFWRRRHYASEIPFNKRRPLVQMKMGWRDDDLKMENAITLGRIDTNDLTYYVVFDKQENRDNDRFFMEYPLALSYHYHRIGGKQRAQVYLDNRSKEWRSVEELRFAVQGRVDP